MSEIRTGEPSKYSDIAEKIGQLQDMTDPIAIDEFIDGRLAELDTSTHAPGVLTIFSEPYSDFISTKTEVRPIAVVRGIILDDNSKYRHFLKSFKMFAQGYDLSEARTYEEAALLGAQYGTGYYFDTNPLPEPEASSQRASLLGFIGSDRVHSITEFIGCAACTEKTAVTHNLLQFAGVKSYFITGGSKKPDATSAIAHNFLVAELAEGKKVIMDPSNPFRYRKQPGGPVDFLLPAVFDGGDKIVDDELTLLDKQTTFSAVDLSYVTSAMHEEGVPLQTLGIFKAFSNNHIFIHGA